MKITFLAVFRIAASRVYDPDCENRSSGERKYPATPVPAISKNTLRLMMRSMSLVTKNELEFVQQRPLQRFCATLVSQPTHDGCRDLNFIGIWISIQRSQVESFDNRQRICGFSQQP